MAIRGPKPQPKALQLVKDGQSPADEEFENEGPQRSIEEMPKPFAWMPNEAKKEWRRVGEQLALLGLVSEIDFGAFTAYCLAWGRLVECEKAIKAAAKKDPLGLGFVTQTQKNNQIQHPLLSVANRAAADVVKYAAEFGMTPSARTRVAAHDPKASTRPASQQKTVANSYYD